MRKTIAIALTLITALILVGALGATLLSDAPSPEGAPAEVASASDVEAPPPGSIQGRVLRPDGQPIGGATVTAGEREVTTDDRGVFTFTALGAGAHLLDAAAEGHVSPGPAGARGKRVELPAADGPPLTNVELVLREPGELSGRVVASGAPIEGARISAYYLFADGVGGPLEPFALDAVATSGEGGAFSTGAIAPGRLRLLVEAEGWALAESRELLLDDGQQVTDLTIDLAPSGDLALTIVDEAGDPIRAEVVVSSPQMRARRRRAPASGELVLMGLPVGQLALTATAPGYRAEELTAQLKAGEATSIDVVMERSGGLIGRVIDGQGEPWPNVAVQLEDGDNKRWARTDQQGNFQWDDAPAGAWSATAYSPHHAPSPPTSLRRGELTTLALGDAGSIEGRVVTAAGVPVQSFRLAVEDLEVDGPRPYSTRAYGTPSFARPDGRFELGPLRPGVYYVRASPEGYASALSGRIEVNAGATTRNVIITVAAAGAIRGQVKARDTSAPLAGAVVELFEPMSAFPRTRTRTDAQGRYTLDGVSPGRRSVRVSHRDYLTQVAAGVQVPEGAEASRDVTLEPRSPDARFSFHGIGAVLEKSARGARIKQVMEGSPASVFGLEGGDFIRGIDGEDTSQMRLTEIVNRIRGEEGVPVSIEIDRPGEGVMTIEVERGSVVVKDQTGRPR